LESIRLLFFYNGIQKYIRGRELLKLIKEFITSIPQPFQHNSRSYSLFFATKVFKMPISGIWT